MLPGPHEWIGLYIRFPGAPATGSIQRAIRYRLAFFTPLFAATKAPPTAHIILPLLLLRSRARQ